MMLGMFLCIYSFSQDYIFMLIDPKGIHYKRRRKEDQFLFFSFSISLCVLEKKGMGWIIRLVSLITILLGIQREIVISVLSLMKMEKNLSLHSLVYFFIFFLNFKNIRKK